MICSIPFGRYFLKFLSAFSKVKVVAGIETLFRGVLYPLCFIVETLLLAGK